MAAQRGEEEQHLCVQEGMDVLSHYGFLQERFCHCKDKAFSTQPSLAEQKIRKAKPEQNSRDDSPTTNVGILTTEDT